MQSTKRSQSGAVLVVSLIMLVVLTILVISAVMSSNTNLRITGNMQVKDEASSAAQQAIEQVIDINNPVDFTTIVTPSQTINIDTGLATYAVVVEKPSCLNTTPVFSNDPGLDITKEDDKLCIGENDPLDLFDSEGKPVAKLTKCNDQQWNVRASVTDTSTGAAVTHQQGVAKRSYKPTSC
ncbi:pilus assembly PilX family protein [Noviherbaspirillum sedimenti]